MRNYKSIIVLTIVRCVAATGLYEGTAAAQIQSRVAAAAGAPAPAGGNYQSFQSVSMNRGGQAAFLAGLTGTSNAGIFVIDHAATSAVALAGNTGFLFLGAPGITANGDVLFITDTGLFRSRGKDVLSVARNGDIVPGVGALTPESFSVAPNGSVAFSAAIAGGTSTAGIFRAID